EIRRGARRAIMEIVITPDPDEREIKESFRVWSGSDIESGTPEDLRKHLLNSGLWPLIQMRPLAKTARPGSQPAAIFINAMSTAPLQAKTTLLLQNRAEDFITGVTALQKFNAGKTYLTVHKNDAPVPGADSLKNVETHTFSGPHPSGLPGLHIRKIQPLKRGETIWTIRAEDAADIGSFLRTGQFPTERIIALVGSQVNKPQYLRTRVGADLPTLTKGRIDDSVPVRYINGDVLSGITTNPVNHLGIHHSTITIIPEGNTRDFMGWGMPGFTSYSAMRTFASCLLPQKKRNLDTRTHGGKRPIVDIGQWGKVFPFDIHLSYLIRAIQAEDIEEAEALGLLELAEEDVALCSFIDPSKLELCDIIRRGLNLYEAENF
ncbi:NADH:ubiquinone reductase (Na(+)-transporting) subunit A, partial [bacterium]|nr:NADH:ubiquinone reductase (Na(+)-transporting) subunit A [bacterium]